MAVVRTQINCPNCNQPIAAEIEQIFDVGVDPSAKQRFLSGQFNLANCPHCGFHGNIATTLIYHDPAKDLLMTFTPPNLNLAMPEQEKAMGRLIKQVVDSLPQEQRKGYIFSPQQALTLQGLVERILSEDGVTKEMIEAQQLRVNLVQRLAGITDDEALEIVAKEEDAQIDGEFFTLINRLIEASLGQGDQNGAKQLTDLQQRLLPITTFGRELQAQSDEVAAAIETLKEAGEDLTREKLLEFVIEAPNDVRVNAFVSLARPGMDYEFFTLLSSHIDKAKGEKKKHLEKLRETLLEATRLVDQQLEERLNMSAKNLETLLQVEDIRGATLQNLPAIDEFFFQVLNDELEKAKQAKDTDREDKLMQIIQVINEASQASAGPDTVLLQQLLDADDDARKKIYEERAADINPQFIEALTGLLVQLEAGGDDQKEMTDKVRKVYREAVRISMRSSMQAETN